MIRVVIVDEDRHIRDVAAEVLRAGGCRVRPYADTREALQSLRIDGADVAIVDFDLASHAGFRLAEMICASEELEDVALIGVAFELSRVSLDLVDLAVAKPYTVLDLPALVRRAIERGGA